MRLRDVEPGDLNAYVRMRCDPAMMAELGGPLPRDGIAAKVETDVRKTRADDDGRWGVVHAFPGVTNAASKALCRSVGFTFVGERDVTFAGRLLRTNHWRIDPSTDLV
jgi:RimJ/RimL family protein N-acetyltransferase